MKKKYDAPIMEIVELEIDDVVTTSGESGLFGNESGSGNEGDYSDFW